jgi:hypothetical protein
MWFNIRVDVLRTSIQRLGTDEEKTATTPVAILSRTLAVQARGHDRELPHTARQRAS